MRSMLIIGLGRFGTNLAMKLAELGNEVMVIDENEELVNKVAPFVTQAQIGNCMDEEVLRSLGVHNFNVCFVCISEYFQSALEITSLLKEMGARYVVSKTDKDLHAKFLLKVGADEVVHPERDMANRVAFKFSMDNAFEYIELTPGYAIFEIKVPKAWAGKTVRELDIRTKYNVNIIAVRNGDMVVPLIDAGYTFGSDEHLLIAGSKKDGIRLMDKS